MTRDVFLSDVKDHEMTVVHNSGLHRHVRFAKPRTSTMSFGLVTWPGYLAFYGDMGEFVFARLTDMFQFFRGHTTPSFDYWAEKLCATDKSDGHEEFCVDRLKDVVNDRLLCFVENHEVSPADVDELTELLGWSVISCESQESASAAAAGFEYLTSTGDVFRLEDFWDSKLMKHTERYLWCCYALPWAIQRYDEHNKETQ